MYYSFFVLFFVLPRKVLISLHFSFINTNNTKNNNKQNKREGKN